MRKEDLKNARIVQTRHDRFGVVELDKNRINFCYDQFSPDNEKCLTYESMDDIVEINGILGIGGYVTKELKEKYPESLYDKKIGDPYIWYEIDAIYELNKISDN